MVLLILFLIGLCVGSFLNVVIDRIPNNESILFGRSHCDFCKKTLAWYDLIPIVSFISTKGACRYCHKKLSLQYPLIELLVGIIFVGVFLLLPYVSSGLIFLYVLDVTLLTTALALFAMDIKYQMLSDKLVIVLLSGVFIKLFIEQPTMILNHLFIGIVAMLPLFLIFLFTKGKGMGLGDVKLVGVLGFLLGFPSVVVMYYIAFLTGAVVGIILIIARKKQFSGSIIAFGPFLIFGGLVAFFWGEIVWKYLLAFLGL